MPKFLAVAAYTYLEGVRARFFVGALLVSLFVVGIGAVVGSLPYGTTDVIIARIGWDAVFLTGMLVSVIYAIQQMSTEREGRVLHMLLARPVARGAYALGKFLGTFSLTITAVFATGLVLMLLLLTVGQFPHDFWYEWLVPSAFISLKCGVLVAVALLMGLISSPVVAILFTVTYYLLGIGSHDFVLFAEQSDRAVLVAIAEALSWLAPQFPVYDFAGWTLHGVELMPEVYLQGGLYFGGYLVILLAILMTSLELIEVP